jgi:hypothetical protein
MTTFVRLLFLLAGILLAMASCKRSDESESGITRRIHQFDKRSCPGGTVTRYDFQGTAVFVFADSCNYSDGGYAVTDANGSDICFLSGFAGGSHCRGSHFDSNATNPVLVFRKR